MHRCFAQVIGPVLGIARPETIVEVGAGAGQTTRAVLRSLGERPARVHAIDPALAIDHDELDDPRLQLHRCTGQAALPSIGPADVALLDGDPNWWTVRGELQALADAAQAARRPPPVVVLHHVHWPFGRRDGYHDPATLPLEAAPHAVAAGLDPLAGAPVAGGLRLTPWVAEHEQGPRNGVLTAAEDFLDAQDEPWELVEVPGYHGVAVLVAASAIAANPALKGLLSHLESAATLRRAARRIEAGRVRAVLTTSSADEAALAAARQAEADALAEVEAATSRAARAEALTATTAAEVERLAGELTVLQTAAAELAAVRAEAEALEAARAASAADGARLQERLDAAQTEGEGLRARIADAEAAATQARADAGLLRDALAAATSAAHAARAEADRVLEARDARIAALQERADRGERDRADLAAALWRAERLEEDLAAREAARSAAAEARELEARRAVETALRLDQAHAGLEATQAELRAAQASLVRLERDALTAGDEARRRGERISHLEDEARVLSGRASHLTDSLEAVRHERDAALARVQALEAHVTALVDHEAAVLELLHAAQDRPLRLLDRLGRGRRRREELELAVRALEAPRLPAPAREDTLEEQMHGLTRNLR